ncbi:MAG: hypothetical protein IKP40_02435, partial [Clostridia bacterium]|nr:hypothetical protein [Clostridia bacterium]
MAGTGPGHQNSMIITDSAGKVHRKKPVFRAIAYKPMIRMSKGRFHELSHDWLWKTAEITTTSRGSKVESALLSPLPT